jgi:hypothetical protein
MEELPRILNCRIVNYGRLSKHQRLMAMQRLCSDLRYYHMPTHAMAGNARRRELLAKVRGRTRVLVARNLGSLVGADLWRKS